MDQIYILWGQESTLDLAKIKAWSKMTNFIRYKDEIINLDLVASISKSEHVNTKIYFYGAYIPDGSSGMLNSLTLDNEEIRDKAFDAICYIIANNLNCSLSCITEIGTIKT